MSAILDIHNEWRDSLRLASFRGVFFHVETSGRQSGRRTVTHQYPKRNLPHAEDMGREAVHWSFTGYLILNDKKLGSLITRRNQLIEALEMDGPGELIHPSLSYTFEGGKTGSSFGGPMIVMCERYSISENRQKGGFYEFDMQFVEAGEPPRAARFDTRAMLKLGTDKMDQAAINQLRELMDTERKFPRQMLPGSRPGALVGPLEFAGPTAIRIPMTAAALRQLLVQRVGGGQFPFELDAIKRQ